MKNPSLYVGFVLMSDEADGHKRVSTFDGISWHGLDDLQVTLLEDILTAEFGAKFDALKQEIRARTVEMGYGNAIINEDQDPAEIEKLRDMARGGQGKGNGIVR